MVKAARCSCVSLAYLRRAAAAGWFGRGTPSAASDAGPVAAFRLPAGAQLPGWLLAIPARLPPSEPQLLLEQIIDGLRVGLAASRFHDLPDEPADCLWIGLGVRDLVRVGGDHGFDGRLDGARVGDLA